MIQPPRDTIPHLLMARASKTPGQVALRDKHEGVWRERTWRDYEGEMRHAALGLRAFGLESGDRVAIHSENRPEWVFADLGTQAAGGISVGIYPTSPAEEVGYLLRHSGARFLVAEDQEQVDKALAAGELPDLERIFVVDIRGFRGYEDPRLVDFDELMARGREAESNQSADFDRLLEKLDPDDTATLVYTSGTTGLPKGAMITGRNGIAAARSVSQLFHPSDQDELLSYLPLCHVAEKVFTYYVAIAGGATVSFAESPETVAADLTEIGPTVFFGVPRIWEKMQASITIRMESASWLKRMTYDLSTRWAEHMAAEKIERGHVRLRSRLLNWLGWVLVYRALKRRLGLDRVRVALSGAAPIAPEVLTFFTGLGVPIVEVYGMTESTGISHAVRREDVEVGTVGRPVDGIDQRIAPDGELLLRGPTIFKGYFGASEETAAALEGGWLHTGDVAELTPRGNVQIIDRKKDIIITAGGKNISPAMVESALKTSPYIREAIVIGEGMKYVTALIGIELDTVGNWAERQRIPYTTYRDLSERPEVVGLITEEVNRINDRLARVEQVKKFRLIPKELDAEDAELTATQKVKRSVIDEMYSDLIAEMY